MTDTAPGIRDVVTVVGPDARRYLHSQVAQDIEALAVGEGRWTSCWRRTGGSTCSRGSTR